MHKNKAGPINPQALRAIGPTGGGALRTAQEGGKPNRKQRRMAVVTTKKKRVEQLHKAQKLVVRVLKKMQKREIAASEAVAANE